MLIIITMQCTGTSNYRLNKTTLSIFTPSNVFLDARLIQLDGGITAMFTLFNQIEFDVEFNLTEHSCVEPNRR